MHVTSLKLDQEISKVLKMRNAGLSLIILKMVLLVFFLITTGAYADTPANCSFEQIEGTWRFYLGQSGSDKNIECTSPWEPVTTFDVTLHFPDVVVNKDGILGFWTMIYNQGFEVVLHGKKFFGFSHYEIQHQQFVASFCNESSGWAHNIDQSDWACFRSELVDAKYPSAANEVNVYKLDNYGSDSRRKYKPTQSFINDINKKQSSWKATMYKEYKNVTMQEMRRRAGGQQWTMGKPETMPPTRNLQLNVATSALPDSFDWRNVDGVSYVPPVRNQFYCGSCYAFASTALHESRLRVMTNNTFMVLLSPQEIISCSKYAQGCEGGFPYLVAGKYGQDFGFVADSCYTYIGRDTPCPPLSCRRFYASQYHYIGGFYGACNEDLMKIELLRNGPIAVSFEVYDDFLFYQRGIYHHTGLVNRFNPWQTTNHVVVIVGYGYEGASPETGEKYWIVQNTWGTAWGEDGYFRIRRGVNECHIESMAVATTPSSI